GVDDTAYAGGRWEIDIKVPPTYPNEPPKMKFVTRIFHPNIDWKTDCPEPSSPLNCDAGNCLRAGDSRAYRSLVQLYISMYCKKE
ncbi:hypothetical protein KIPB_006569, partial [Kipferlia bialata]